MAKFGAELKVNFSILLVCIVVSAIVGGLIGAFLVGFIPKDNNTLIKDFYDVENAAKVSPSDYVGSINEGKPLGLLVDLRMQSEYSAGHLEGAINIPAPQMDEAQLVAAFVSLPKDKEIITYCYSSYCMLSANVGKVLSDHGIFVKHFTAGWLEISRDYNAYIVVNNGTVVDANSGSGLVCSADPNATFKC